MSLFHWISGGLLGAAWFSRVVGAGFGMPKIPDIAYPAWDRWPEAAHGVPRVSIIVPAKNEQETIAGVLRDLLSLDYPNLEVIAVDDRSTDQTGERMDEVAATETATGRLNALHITELPGGWLGKTHAMWTASEQATGDWLLFTDADVFFRKDTLRRAVAYAETEHADHLVVFPTLLMGTAGERMMIAFFQSLFTFGHRPWKVADPKAKDHIGVGAFNLVRREVYEKIGTYQALRMEVLDDMKLGKVVKNAGFAQRVVFGDGLLTIRWAKGAFGVVNNFTKNFFAVMSFQWWRTVATAVALIYLNLVPFFFIWFASGWSRAGYALALFSIFLIYSGMSMRTKIPAYYFFLHPVSTALFLYALLRSMFVTLRDGGVTWRGTKYPLEELRKGLV
jgi:glycosyltransferase involved in cell wall biosynthesis